MKSILKRIFGDESGGLSEQELALTVYELHENAGLRFTEIAQCTHRDHNQVRELYKQCRFSGAGNAQTRNRVSTAEDTENQQKRHTNTEDSE